LHQPELPPIAERPYDVEPDYVPQDICESSAFAAARQTVLRCLAVNRQADRRLAEVHDEEFDAEGWRPDPEQIAGLPIDGAARLGRFLAMSDNLANFHAELPASGLREIDQIDPFKSLLDFLHPAAPGEQLPLDLTLAHVMAGGYGKMATGWGKMTALALYAKAAGIGKPPFPGENVPPLKALILAHSKVNMNQLVGNIPAGNTDEFGEELFDGFAKFAPGIKLTRYFGDEKNLEGDGVVVPYLMFELAMKEGRFPLDMFDIILPDEAHHLLGPKIQERLLENTRRLIAVLGVTATSRYNEQKKLGRVLRYRLCEIEKRDLMTIGTLSGIQLFWISTGAKVKVKRNKGDYTEPETAALAQNKARNELILDWVQAFVNEGRQVLVPCIRGQKCWHSEHLAGLSEKRFVTDSKTGEQRPMVGKAVHNYMTDKEYEQVMQDWSEGKVDVIYATDKLRESWNDSRVGAMVLGVITTSELAMDQWTGRVARKDEEFPIKPIVYLRDEFDGHKPPMTPHHIYGVEVVIQGQVISEGGERKPRQMKDNTSVRQVEDLPENLREQLITDPVLISDITLNARAEDYKDPPAEYIPVADTSDYWHGMAYQTVCEVLEKNGYPYVVARGRRGPMRHIHPDGKTFLQNYTPPKLAPLDHKVAGRIARQLGVSERCVLSKAAELKIESKDMFSRATRQLAGHFDAEQAKRIEDGIEEDRTFKPGDEALRHIGAEFNLDGGSMVYFVGDRYPVFNKQMPSGQDAWIVSRKDAHAIRKELRDTQVTAENRRKLIRTMVEESGHNRQKLIKWARIMYDRGNLLKPLCRGRWTNPETGGVITEYFLEETDFNRLNNSINRNAERDGERYELSPEEKKALKQEREALKAAEAQEESDAQDVKKGAEKIHDAREQLILADSTKPQRWKDLDAIMKDIKCSWYTLERHVLPAIEASENAVMNRPNKSTVIWAQTVRDIKTYCQAIPVATSNYQSIYPAAEKTNKSLEYLEETLHEKLDAQPVLMRGSDGKITPHYTNSEIRDLLFGVRMQKWAASTTVQPPGEHY